MRKSLPDIDDIDLNTRIGTLIKIGLILHIRNPRPNRQRHGLGGGGTHQRCGRKKAEARPGDERAAADSAIGIAH